MKTFYGNGNEVVWNPNKNCRVCKFIDGKFETDDENIISILISLGYNPNESDIIVEAENKINEIRKTKKSR